MMNVQGKWKGTIIYGKVYRSAANRELYFEAEISQMDEILTGTATDTGGLGVNPDPASIVGAVSGNRISFVKQYPTRHFMVGGKTIFNRKKKGPEIRYNGEFNPETQTFAGTWLIKQVTKLLGFIPITMEGSGTWTMERK
jgi:hypothetical protein